MVLVCSKNNESTKDTAFHHEDWASWDIKTNTLSLKDPNFQLKKDNYNYLCIN